MRDPLLPLLPGPQDADRPWLICYGIDERVELTGHVLSMWLAKIAGFVTSESVPGDGVHVALPPHWRSVAWACGTWLAGRSVLLGSNEEIRTAGLIPELSVAFTPESLYDEAEAQALVPPASLALRWPDELPALVLDGAADLMHYPDRFTPVSTAADSVCLTDLTSEAAAAGSEGQTVRATLVRRSRTAQALQEVLVAWRAGRTAVVLTPEAGDDVAAAAIRQEGIQEGITT